MSEKRDSWVFALTALAAAAALVSIAGAEILLGLACIAWLIQRPRPVVWPRYVAPMCAFMATTIVAVAMSPQPDAGMGAVRKFVLFTMGLLAAGVVTNPLRARIAHKLLLVVASAASVWAIFQFAKAYIH